MALDKIQAAVTASARTEADRIVKAAEQAARDRVTRETDVARRQEERRYQAGGRAIEEAASRKVTHARGEASKQVLERRNALLDALFDGAKRQLLAMSGDAYADEMRTRLACAAGGDGGLLRVHRDDRPAMAAMLASFNADRPGAARVTLDEGGALHERGGFVFVAKSYEVDQTIDTLVQELRHEWAPRLAADLFGG